jgi:hypothetical protein
MKKLSICTFFALAVLVSCSDNDDNSNTPISSFFPLTATSAWVYNVSLDAQNVGRDSLYVNGETTINGKTYQKFSTASTPTGFYTSVLNNNTIRKEGDQLLLTGTTGLALDAFFPVNVEVTDFVLFKENSANNAELDAISGTIEQDLQGFPLKIEYKLRSIFKESLANYTVPGMVSYTNVKVIQLVANLKVTTLYIVPGINSPVTIAILNPQDVIVSTQYYAEGIGMIYSRTDVNFQVNDFSQLGIELPIPQEGSSTVEEFLD